MINVEIMEVMEMDDLRVKITGQSQDQRTPQRPKNARYMVKKDTSSVIVQTGKTNLMRQLTLLMRRNIM